LQYTPDVQPDVVFVRYVLHYLTNTQATQLLSHVAEYCKRIVLIQFVNDWSVIDMKRTISQGSGDHAKTFYGWGELFTLCDQSPWRIQRTATVQTTVTADFYKNRLSVTDAPQHSESIIMIELQKTGSNR